MACSKDEGTEHERRPENTESPQQKMNDGLQIC